MKFKARATVTFGGVAIILIGIAYYERHGAIPYFELGRRQPMFPLGVVISGIAICLLAWLPQKWVARLSRTREPRESHVLKYLDDHSHKHADGKRSST